MSSNTNNSRNAIQVPVPVELIPFQDWSYVEVVRDYHKHLGDTSSQAKLALLNEVIKPYRKEKGNDLAALRYLSLAVYMGGIMTVDCMRALEMVRNHKLNAQVKRQLSDDELKSWQADDVNLDRIKAEEEADKQRTQKAATQTNVSAKKQETKSGIDVFVEAIYGSRKKFDELINDFFGFDINKAEGMSAAEFGTYYARCKELGWRKANKA